MHLVIRYFDGCPNWKVARKRLDQALRATDRGTHTVELELVQTEEDADRLSFRGSPTILIDGRDPFSPEDAPVGLSCRVYLTEDGLEGAPSVAQLRRVLAASK